jgi:anaerobic dimethyl sulfoxide reductase subunit A
MRRTGERGEGKFERISWDEALDKIANELSRVRSSYGPSSVLFLGGGGDATQLHTAGLIIGLLALTGGYTDKWGIQSFEGGLFASLATYGTLSSHNDFNDLLNSRLIIMWGWDPVTTIHQTNTSWYLLNAKESGTRIISVDPRYTDSAAVLANQWIPIRPGTDTAVLIAMAHVIISNNLHDQAFIDKYSVGFETFRDYILGMEDGIAKTPAWAETISGVPAKVIKALAIDYATTKPSALIGGIGPGRSAYGEQYHRATKTLAAMTGNVGIHGGWSGRSSAPQVQFGGYDFKLARLPSGANPVDAEAPPRKDSLPTLKGSDSSARIHTAEVADAILKGRAGGYPADLKMVLIMHTNPINQYPNTNKMVAAMKKLEFVAVCEQLMTATAKFADILLPVSTYMERNDITVGGVTPIYGYVKKIIKPLHESKSPLEICQSLASRLGASRYYDKTEDEWLKDMTRGSYIPDYDSFKREAVYRLKFLEPRVAFKEQIENPENNPFPTPSGKIEIYSQRLASMNNTNIPPIPKYIEPWESPHDALASKYPLQLITTHFKRRAHTQFDRTPWLKELMPHAISINSEDAQARGIENGDKVRVFNNRGEIIVPARVTERIMPGVVDLPQGAWYQPDSRGIDHGGCANVLTRDAHSPGGATCHNTALVEIEKV